MNRQEAINILTGLYRVPVENGSDEFVSEINKAIDMAIDALNHQTVFDQIFCEGRLRDRLCFGGRSRR